MEARGRSFLIKISAILTAPGGLKAGLTSLFVVVILYFSAPSVAHFAMNSGMTGFTYSLEVADVVSSALRERFNVVNCLGWCISSFRKADLAERMLGGIGFTNDCPCFTVAFPGFRISLVLLVASCFCFGMLLTEPSVSELRASREGAGSFWSFWHFVFPIKKPCNQNGGRALNEKAPRGFLRALIVLFHYFRL